MLNLQNLEL